MILGIDHIACSVPENEFENIFCPQFVRGKIVEIFEIVRR